jgi:hypothetical protein
VLTLLLVQPVVLCDEVGGLRSRRRRMCLWVN